MIPRHVVLWLLFGAILVPAAPTCCWTPPILSDADRDPSARLASRDVTDVEIASWKETVEFRDKLRDASLLPASQPLPPLNHDGARVICRSTSVAAVDSARNHPLQV